MKLARLFPALVALAVVATAGCAETDPKKPATWIAKLEQKDAKAVADAARELRKMKAKEAVQPLVALLGHDSMAVREEAAYALMEIGDPAAVQPLIDAIDLATTAKGAERANSRIAEALGNLGDRKAVPALMRMFESKDPYVKLAAVDALGKLADQQAVPKLVSFVESDSTPPLITKKAIIALGDMRAGGGVNSLVKAMVMERQGVSFFPESSYALFQVGSPAQQAISAIIDGSDKAYLAWAEEKGRAAAGYLSKSAVILGDLGDPAAIPALVKLAQWNEPNGDEGFQMIVRKTAAEALGRLRAAEGVKVITPQLTITEANMREAFATALAHIGDKSVLPKLEAAAKNQKDSWSARQAAMTGLGLLGDGKNKAVFEAYLKSETGDAAVKHCMDEPSNGPEALKQARCEKERTERPKFLENELARLAAADACQADAACWIGKLNDANGKVKERAAYELGKLQDVKAIDALVAAAKSDDLHARRATFIALDWFTRNPAAKDALKAKADVLAKQYEEEKGRAHTFVVNEDLKRVVWKVQHL